MHRLIVDDSIWEKYPEYRCLVVYATRLDNRAPSVDSLQRLRQAEAEIRSRFSAPNSFPVAHISAWRDAYRQFGAKPKKHLCSAEALISRVLANEELPDINPIVNTYNRISLQHIVPVGGEDWAKLSSRNSLRFSNAREEFKTRRAGEESMEHPDIGEVIWCDSEGVTCRRWNWRQCLRTAITNETTAAYFVIDTLPPFDLQHALQAADDLCSDLLHFSPTADFEREVWQKAQLRTAGRNQDKLG